MKAILYLGAAVALLRSVAAFLPGNDDPHDIYNQLVFQPTGAVDKAIKNPAASTEHVEIGIPASPFGADAPLNHNAASPGSEHTHSQDDMDLAAALSPQEPKFTIGTNTSQWAITYTPYTDELTCLPPATMRSDVAAIARKGFTTIRLYSIDCSALHHIAPAARTHGLKLIIGIPLDDGLDSASAQLSDLIAWAVPTPTPNTNLTSTPDTTTNPPINNWPLIELIVLGNDALLNAHTTPATLSTLLTTSRSHLRSHNYPGPLTTTEPLSLLSQHAALLCPTLDVPAATIHPFFHHAVTASLAAEYVASELAHLSTLCPNLVNERAVALETGWPKRGRANGRAVPGVVEQEVAVRGIRERVGGRSVLVGWGDEVWRDGGEFGVEGSWGCGDIF